MSEEYDRAVEELTSMLKEQYSSDSIECMIFVVTHEELLYKIIRDVIKGKWQNKKESLR